MVSDYVHEAVVLGYRRLEPNHVLRKGPVESGVMLHCVRVVCRPNQFQISSIDTTAVSQYNLFDFSPMILHRASYIVESNCNTIEIVWNG